MNNDVKYIVKFFEPEYEYKDYSMEDWYFSGNEKVQEILLTIVLVVNTYGVDKQHSGKRYINKIEELIYDKMRFLNDEECEYVEFRIKDAIKRLEEKEHESVLLKVKI